MYICTTISLQKLTAYFRNNWRPLITEAANKTTVRFTAAEYIYHHKPELVEEQLREMLDWDPSKPIDYARPECFQNRTKAIKNVLDNMTVRDREEVEAQVEFLRHTGLPPEMQRR
jgi:hypothetical protein